MSPEIILFSLATLFFSSCTALTEKEAYDIFYPDNIESEFVTQCYGKYGCFYTGPPFYDEKYRPVSVPPANDTDPRYYLFTPENKDTAFELYTENENYKDSNFDGSLPTKVLIHGLQVKDLASFFAMKDALLNLDKFNVIVVDWTHDNSFPPYQAVANARIIGAKVAYLLNALMKTYSEMTPESIHIISHSLGAQVSGYVGERVKNLGRISGLDPGGPYFHHVSNEVRLEYTDANFVDIVHTNGGVNLTTGIGIFEEVGHADFYPNGGNGQPGCESGNVISNAPTQYVANTCSHNRAIFLYTSSISNAGNDDCNFLARHAKSWEDFQSMKDDSSSVSSDEFNNMGYFAKKPDFPPDNARYYLRTSKDPPYCLKDGYLPA